MDILEFLTKNILNFFACLIESITFNMFNYKHENLMQKVLKLCKKQELTSLEPRC